MNRKEITKHKKKKSNKLKILFWGILVSFVAVLVLFLFSLGGKGIGEILNMRDYWLSIGVANGLILIGFLMMYRVDAQNIALNENDLEDTEWLSVKRLKKLKEFQVYDYKSAEEKTDGIVIGAEKKGGSVEVITTSQLHALIVGTTGSGKTTGFVDQNIAVLGKSKGKPSIVISDPKKELYEKHARTLEKEGYKISVLDLREPYSSERWNPMNVLLRRIRLVKDLENNLQQKDGKYYGAGEVFLSYRDARTRMQELKDEIYENAQDLVYTLCPVQNRDQPTWEQGARNLLFGFVLAMCEDCIKGKIDESQLVLFNVYHADLIDFNFQSLFANKNNTVANAQMLLVFRFIEQEVINAREANKSGKNLRTLIISDEAHLFIDAKFPIALDFFFSMSKRIRKYNGSFIPATQNIADWNANEELRSKTSAILKNSQYTFIFKLSAPDMKDVLDVYKAGDSFNADEQRMIISAVTGQVFFIGSTELRTNVKITTGEYIKSLFEDKTGENYNKEGV